MDRSLRGAHGDLDLMPDRRGERADNERWPGQRNLTQALSGPGTALPADLRRRLESNLGEDLSGVHVHTDPAAATAARDLNARAFTIGQAVYFGAGQFDPGSRSGQRLIAHEIAHTVQQRGAAGSPQLDSLAVSTPDDAHEHQAEGFAQSFIDASAGTRAPITRVTRGVIARAIIQRDGGSLPGGIPHPSTPHPPPQPVNPREPSPSEMAQGAIRAIQNARASGGTQAVVQQVRSMRAQAQGAAAAAVEQAISSTLTDEEKQALAGNPAPAGTPPQSGGSPQGTGAPPSAGQAPRTGQPGSPTVAATPQSTATPTGTPGPGQPSPGGDPAHANTGQPAQGGTGTPTPGATQTPSPAQSSGQAQPQGPVQPHGATATPSPSATSSPSPTTPTGPTIGPVPHVPVDSAGGRALIEAELAFHDNWRALSAGSGARALHLLSGAPNDLLQGAFGAGVQTGAGQLIQLATTRTPLSRIPGAGNIIGGALSAYSLFSNGGAGLRSTLGSIGSGIGGAFNADNWRESPWQTAADLIAGIKSVLDLIGNVCNMLSGLAYAFAAIAAVGGLLSVFFPPLAFLVPYIPAAVNFGRACGGIATVCMTVSNLISPIPPILRAIHIIFSDNDPIKLAAQEQTYHQEIQGAIANYGNAAADRALAGKGANPFAQFHDGVSDGMNTYRSAMGGHLAPTPGNFGQGVANTERAMGGAPRFTDPAQAAQTGRGYFNPEGRTTPNQRSLDKENRRLDHAQANAAYVNDRADQAVVRRDANPTMDNVNQAVRAADTAERHDQIVAGQQQQVSAAEWRMQIPSGAQGRYDGSAPRGGSPGGEVGNSAEGFHQAIASNLNSDRAQTADGAYQQEQAASGDGPPEARRNAQGHIQLPDPPGSLAEVDQLDHQIEDLQHQLPAQRQVTAQATQTASQAGQQAAGITQAQQTVTQRTTQETQRSTQQQARIQQQTADMQSRTGEANSSASSGTNQAAGPIQGIASAARTVDGLLQRVPSNSFFDVGPAQRNVHQFVVGMDQITGAPAGQQQSQQQTNQAVNQRNTQVQQAQSTNQQATGQGQQLAQRMTQDAGTARTAQEQATAIGQQSQATEQTIQQRLATAQQQRAQKWQALMSWAVQHRQLRASVLGAENV